MTMSHPPTDPIGISQVLSWIVGIVGSTFGLTLWLLRDKYETKQIQQDKDMARAVDLLEEKFKERLDHLIKSYDTEISRLLDQQEALQELTRDQIKQLHDMQMKVQKLEITLAFLNQRHDPKE